MHQPPHPTGPTAFLHAPGIQPHRPAPVVVQEPAREYGRARLPQAVPTLTVYPDGEANLNAEASALLGCSTAGICLRRPPAVRAGRTPQLWELGRGECYQVRRRPDKLLLLRFRVALDDSPEPGRYLLLPVAGTQDRFSLLPG